MLDLTKAFDIVAPPRLCLPPGQLEAHLRDWGGKKKERKRRKKKKKEKKEKKEEKKTLFLSSIFVVDLTIVFSVFGKRHEC